MSDWELDWLGPDVVYSLIGVVVACGVFVWWTWWVTKDIKW